MTLKLLGVLMHGGHLCMVVIECIRGAYAWWSLNVLGVLMHGGH